MRLTPRLAALALFGIFLASCTTMTAYEQQRLAKRGAANPAARPTEQGGTLFQPLAPKAPVDTAAMAADRSVAEAEKQLAESDPSRTSGVAPGPSIPVLKSLLVTKKDLEAAWKSYAAYAQAVANVRVSLDAFGLKANIEGVRKTREAGEYWALYLQKMRIRPVDDTIKVDDIKFFYGVVTESGKKVAADISSMNRYIDGQRTKPWAVSKKSIQ